MLPSVLIPPEQIHRGHFHNPALESEAPSRCAARFSSANSLFQILIYGAAGDLKPNGGDPLSCCHQAPHQELQVGVGVGVEEAVVPRRPEEPAKVQLCGELVALSAR